MKSNHTYFRDVDLRVDSYSVGGHVGYSITHLPTGLSVDQDDRKPLSYRLKHCMLDELWGKVVRYDKVKESIRSNSEALYNGREKTVTPEHTETTSMNYSTSVMLINPAILAVKGKYEDTSKDTVFKTLDSTLKVGDMVVVESGTRWNYTTVKITEINASPDFDSTEIIKWVVQKIDVDSHDKLKEMEDKAIQVIKAGELRRRREDIKKNTLDAFANGEIDKLDIAKLTGQTIAIEAVPTPKAAG